MVIVIKKRACCGQMTVADITEYLDVAVAAFLSRSSGLDQRIGRSLHRRKNNATRIRLARFANYLNNFCDALYATDRRAAEF